MISKGNFNFLQRNHRNMPMRQNPKNSASKGEKHAFIQKKQHLPMKKVLLPLESRIFRYSITPLMKNADFIGFFIL